MAMLKNSLLFLTLSIFITVANANEKDHPNDMLMGTATMNLENSGYPITVKWYQGFTNQGLAPFSQHAYMSIKNDSPRYLWCTVNWHPLLLGTPTFPIDTVVSVFVAPNELVQRAARFTGSTTGYDIECKTASWGEFPACAGTLIDGLPPIKARGAVSGDFSMTYQVCPLGSFTGNIAYHNFSQTQGSALDGNLKLQVKFDASFTRVQTITFMGGPMTVTVDGVVYQVTFNALSFGLDENFKPNSVAGSITINGQVIEASPIMSGFLF